MNFLKKLNHIDLLLIAIILLISIVYPLFFINLSILPHEDAAILMRYAKNVAEGYGIVWNPREQPVDGTTDFLFMLLIMFLNYWGMPIEISTLFIIYSSHILIILIIYIFIRILYNGYNLDDLIETSNLVMSYSSTGVLESLYNNIPTLFIYFRKLRKKYPLIFDEVQVKMPELEKILLNKRNFTYKINRVFNDNNYKQEIIRLNNKIFKYFVSSNLT